MNYKEREKYKLEETIKELTKRLNNLENKNDIILTRELRSFPDFPFIKYGTAWRTVESYLNIYTVEDLINSYPKQIMLVRNFGPGKVKELEKWLQKYNLCFIGIEKPEDKKKVYNPKRNRHYYENIRIDMQKYFDELDYYDSVKNWDFSMIKYTEEKLTDWDMYEILRNNTHENSIVLDLGTGGGEKVLSEFPKVKKIIGTDYSKEMINTANENLLKSKKENIEFRLMDNLHMDTPDNYFDVVVARNTCISAYQIYETLKPGGKLILRGVDQLDCWELKKMFKRGQALYDDESISKVDYEDILDAGFRNVEFIPIYIREYYQTKEDLIALLSKTPILDNFSEIDEYDKFLGINHRGLHKNDYNILDEYIEQNSTDKGILLKRIYYGIVAEK